MTDDRYDDTTDDRYAVFNILVKLRNDECSF